MLTVRRSDERGHANHGWLDSRFSFSFAEYYDPAHMGFRALRVINEDHIAAANGFGKHPHRDMEILTYVLSGTIAHEDSTGARGTLTPGELQHMTAGSGVLHSEMNPSATEECHLLQVWLLPNQRGLAPAYEQKRFAVLDEPNRFHALATKDGRSGSFVLHSDAALLAAKLDADAKLTQPLTAGYGWLQVARGSVTVNGTELEQGDAIAAGDEHELQLAAGAAGAELLLFDLE
jgi:hypothetical protein